MSLAVKSTAVMSFAVMPRALATAASLNLSRVACHVSRL